MATQLSRNNGWWFALRGTIAVLFGLVALWSGAALTSLRLLFGAYVLADGLWTFIVNWPNHQVTDHGWLLLLKGMPGIAIGGLICLWPNLTEPVLRALVVVWALLTGTLEVMAVLDLRRVVTCEQRMAWNGLIMRQAIWEKPVERRMPRAR